MIALAEAKPSKLQARRNGEPRSSPPHNTGGPAALTVATCRTLLRYVHVYWPPLHHLPEQPEKVAPYPLSYQWAGSDANKLLPTVACWRTVPFLCSAFSKSSRVSNSTKQPLALPVSRWRSTSTSFTCVHRRRQRAAPPQPAAVNTAQARPRLQLRVEDGGNPLGIGLKRDVADVDLEGRVAGQRPGRHRRPRQAASRVRGPLPRCRGQRRQPIHCRPSETKCLQCPTAGHSYSSAAAQQAAGVQLLSSRSSSAQRLDLLPSGFRNSVICSFLPFLALLPGAGAGEPASQGESEVVTTPTTTSAHRRSDAVPRTPSPPEAMLGEDAILPVWLALIALIRVHPRAGRAPAVTLRHALKHGFKGLGPQASPSNTACKGRFLAL